jgi:hypothetical protein
MPLSWLLPLRPSDLSAAWERVCVAYTIADQKFVTGMWGGVAQAIGFITYQGFALGIQLGPKKVFNWPHK